MYPVQKTTRILEFHKNASAYIFAECGAHCDGLKKLVTPKDANGNRVTFIEAPFPLSTSIQEAIARGDLPANPDCSVMLVPYRSYDDPKYISFLPLGGFLEEVSRHTLALNNTNHVTAFNHPLNDLRHVRGIPFYGYASLTDDDMELLFKYAKAAAGGVTVEVGRYLGGSTVIIALALQREGRPSSFFSFDPILPDAVAATLAKNRVERSKHF